MVTDFTKTTFVQGTSPAINATELNKLGDGIEAMKEAFGAIRVDSATFNATGSSSSNYNLTSYRSAAPDSSELPMLMLIQPTITNAAGATITPSWGVTAYPIYDMSTNAQISGSVIKANQPVIVSFDGTNFWVNGSGSYVQYSATPSAGYFNKSTTNPTGTTRINLEAILYATGVYGSYFNEYASDFAEGYPVEGEYEPGDVIQITADGHYCKNNIDGNSHIAGIVTFLPQCGMLFGTSYGVVPITVCGRILAKVEGKCKYGDYLIPTANGALKACSLDNAPRMAICAMSLSQKDTPEVENILVQVVRG